MPNPILKLLGSVLLVSLITACGSSDTPSSTGSDNATQPERDPDENNDGQPGGNRDIGDGDSNGDATTPPPTGDSNTTEPTEFAYSNGWALKKVVKETLDDNGQTATPYAEILYDNDFANRRVVETVHYFDFWPVQTSTTLADRYGRASNVTFRSSTDQVRLSYNALGQLNTLRSDELHISYSYDDENRLFQVARYSFINNPVGQLNNYVTLYYEQNSGKAVIAERNPSQEPYWGSEYKFDTQGRVIEVLEPTGTRTNVEYDAYSNPTSYTIFTSGDGAPAQRRLRFIYERSDKPFFNFALMQVSIENPVLLNSW